MRKVHVVLIAVLGFGAVVGVAEAGDRAMAHNWATSAVKDDNAQGDALRLYTGKRNLANETPWSDSAQVQGDPNDPAFHRNRPMDHANPWQPGVIHPSVPAMSKAPVDRNLSL